MHPTRKIAVEFAGVFLIGAMIGGLVAWDLNASELSQWMSRINDPDSMVARIDKKYTDTYQLSPEEMEKIQPLIKEMAQHIYQVRHQFGVDIIAVSDSYHKKISEQMTPEHRAVYDKANEDRKKKISSLLLLDQNPPDQGQK